MTAHATSIDKKKRLIFFVMLYFVFIVMLSPLQYWIDILRGFESGDRHILLRPFSGGSFFFFAMVLCFESIILSIQFFQRMFDEIKMAGGVADSGKFITTAAFGIVIPLFSSLVIFTLYVLQEFEQIPDEGSPFFMVGQQTAAVFTALGFNFFTHHRSVN